MLLFGLSENFCIFPLPVDTILLIIRTLPVISMCTSLHQLLFKVFHVLPFTLFCAISATLTLSVLTGTSRALLLLFILYPEKFHMSWSYYPLCHQNNYCISVQHINCRKKKKKKYVYISVTFWKTLSGQSSIKYEQMWEKYIYVWNDSSSFHSSELFYLNFQCW